MGRTHGRSGQLCHHLGHSKAVVFADAIEEPHGVVLHHDIVGGERLLDFVHPPLDDISTALTAEMLRGEEGGIIDITEQVNFNGYTMESPC